MIRLPAATLTANYDRYFPGDGAFLALPPLPEDLAESADEPTRAAHKAATEAHERAREERTAAFAKFNETGLWHFLAPMVIPGEKPVQFKLRHLRGRVSEELADILRPTATEEDGLTISTLIALAALSIAEINDWDGPELKFRVHKRFKFQILDDDSLDLLCTVSGLVPWLGRQALEARSLRPL